VAASVRSDLPLKGLLVLGFLIYGFCQVGEGENIFTGG
jgi:hypothetical protein